MNLDWKLKEINLELAFDWSISREVSKFKRNFFVCINERPFGEIAPNIRFEEDRANIENMFAALSTSLPKVYDEKDFIEKTLNILDNIKNLPNSLRYGLESAAVNYLCYMRKIRLSDFLFEQDDCLIKDCRTLFSLPILELDQYAPFFQKLRLDRFKMIKIKASTIKVAERVAIVKDLTDSDVCVDFNEAFNSFSDFEPVYKDLVSHRLKFIEQPFPENKWNEYERLLKLGEIDVFLDESITSQEITPGLKKYCDGINIKLMKSGGIINAKRQLTQAKRLGIKIMLGCMVETSLSIYNALQLTAFSNYQDLDGFLLLKNDPVKKLIESNGLISINNLGVD